MTKIKIHTKRLPDNRLIHINELIDLLKDRPTYTYSICNLKPVSKSKESGFSKKRYQNADIRYPIIIDSDNNVLDGRHRLLKLMDKKETIIQVKIASKEAIEKCIL